jgi:adenylate cyclase
VAVAPNDADSYETLAEILAWSGQPEESLRMIRLAMRLNPHHPFFYLWTLGHSYYLTNRRPEALDAFAELVQRNPNFVPAHAYRAVLLSELGRMKEAREAWDRASAISPGASMPNLRERLPYKRPADLERFLAAVHRVGMP